MVDDTDRLPFPQGCASLYRRCPGADNSYYGVNSVILAHQGVSEKVIKHISHAYRIIYQGNSSLFDALLMIKDQVPMSEEIQHIIDFINDSKLGIIGR